VRAGAGEPDALRLEDGAQLADRAHEVGERVVDAVADPGDELERRLHELVLDRRVLALRVHPGEVGDDRAGLRAQLPGGDVHELELPLDAERVRARGAELDLHGGPLARLTREATRRRRPPPSARRS
jgi:hypothetical protein